MNKTLLSLLALASSACGGSSVTFGAVDSGAVPSTGDGATSGSATGGDSGAATADGSAPSPPTGPSYEVHLRATQAPVTFTDGYSGETPLDQRIGIRTLTLLRAANDPAPVVVFDNGANAVEAGLNDGDDTVCGYGLPSSIPAGTFTVARVTVGYYDFKVAATLHSNGTVVPGDYHDLEVLTNGTRVSGATFNQGHYSFTFEVSGTAYGTLTGDDLVTPVDDAPGGLSLVASSGEADYVFPVNVTTNPALASTVKVVLTVNTYRNFRWQDETKGGYEAGVFDTTPSSYEPVMSFGANSFTVALE